MNYLALVQVSGSAGDSFISSSVSVQRAES